MNTVDATLDELTADPHPLLAAARARSPIARLPVLDAWIVTSRAAAIDVMRDPDVVRIAKARGVSAAQVALRWVVQQGVVAVTASMERSYDVEDLHVFGFELSAAEMALLTEK